MKPFYNWKMPLPSNGTVLPAKIQPAHLRPLAYRILSKKYGLSIKSDGLTALANIIGSRFGTNWKKNPDTLRFLEEFAQVWKQQDRGLFIDQSGCQLVLDEIEQRNCFENSQYNSDSNWSDQSVAMGTQTNSDYNNLIWTDYYKIINASEQYYFPYDGFKKQYLSPQQPISLITDLNRKMASYMIRYCIIRDRTLRNENFQNANDSFNPLSSMVALQNDLLQNNLDTSTPATYMAITQIKNLLGRDGQNFLILGLLTYNVEGNLQMEDLSGKIEVDISQANPTEGLYYYPGCIVLAEGIYFTVGHRFHITSLTHPPAERREVTQDAIGNIDFLNICNNNNNVLGGPITRITNDLKIRLLSLEQELNAQNLSNFIILGGDIFLHEDNTFNALKKIFQRIENDLIESRVAPIGIIFFGSFTSSPIYPSYSETQITTGKSYQMNFDRLYHLLAQFVNIVENCQLIFVPGPNDPWGGSVLLGDGPALPQEPIPSYFVKKLKKLGGNVKWVSNPSRIAFLSQEIVLVRDDINRKFKKYSIDFPLLEEEAKLNTDLNHETEISDNEYVEDSSDSEDGPIVRHETLPEVPEVQFNITETRKYVKTLLDQGHLKPFASSSINYNRDHTLILSPLPSVLIVCDPTVPRFDLTYNGCKTINPGKFILNKTARYLVFNATTRTVHEEAIVF